MATERIDVLAVMVSEIEIERIVDVALSRMADVATRSDVDCTYSEADIVSAVISDPTGDTARFLAGVIAGAIELSTLMNHLEAA